MALIKCPECGREISSFAKSCPSCGCPIGEIKASKVVKIRLPNIELGYFGVFSSRKATVKTADERILWQGQHGQTAVFEINSPTEIVIDLGNWVQYFGGMVEPGKKYNCIQDLGIHLRETYRLTEVGVIDSD